VVQYGGMILPLMHLGELLNQRISSVASLSMQLPDASNTAMLQVVVYSENGRSVGLVVDRILDIVETDLAIQHAGKRLGVLGSAVIQNRVTDLLDIHNLISATDQEFFAPLPATLAV
jgi:two-component system chemotaxis sensor kinase CheA